MPRRADVVWAALTAALSIGLLLGEVPEVDDPSDREADVVLGALLAVAACAMVAVRRRNPLAAAVVALACAVSGLALGYTVIVPIVVGLVLCGQAAIHSVPRVTLPLAAYAGTVVAAAVVVAGTDPATPVIMQIVGGLAIGATPVLIGDAIRSERERTREARGQVVEERLRIARDVHDITGHHLSAISLQAAGASRATSDPVARDALEHIHRLTSEALGQTRRVLGVLRESGPAALAPTPRLEHVEQLLEPARDAGLAVELRFEGAARPLSDEVEVCAYRVVQESLTNVVRHASASAVHVDIAYGERALEIAVEDDGVGGPGRPGGGIEGMRERVGIVGGSFAAGPSGRGWSVRASLPLAPERDLGSTTERGRVSEPAS